MLLLIQYTLIFSSVLTLVALGGCISEHSGVINLGLEGIMVIGALGGALVMSNLAALPGPLLVILSILAAIAFGMLYSCLLGVACINFKADQTLVGTAMNLLGTAGATVFVKAMNTAVVVVYILLYKTKFGLRLMACGEHPQAADSVGINVYRMRWSGVLLSGLLGGMGGLCYILAGVSLWKFENGVAGFGFLALAVMIFGQWKPIRIAVSALLFGLFRALSNVYSGFDFLAALNIPGNVYNMLPYIISLVVLAFTSKKSRAPKAEGIPYDKGQR